MKNRIIRLLLFVAVLCTVGCSKSSDGGQEYSLKISNQYFEPIDSVMVVNNDIIFRGLEVGDTTQRFMLHTGIYNLQFYTESMLVIRSTLAIKGQQQEVVVVINGGGKIELH